MSLAMAIAAVLAAVACKPVQVIDAPDAGDKRRDCAQKPIAFCDALPPGATGGCAADPTAKSIVVRGLPEGARYPLGCVANQLVPIVDGDCRIAATCRCSNVIHDGGTDGGPAWSCFP